jgi:hypothetical protein
MNNTDFVLNGKNIVNDGVVIKIKLSNEEREILLREGLLGKSCFY